MDLATPALAAGLGWTAGMRSMSPLALLSTALAGRRRLRQPAKTLGSPLVRRLLTAAAAGELIADKLPGMPARTAPPALAGRVVSGALLGAAVAAARRASPVPAVFAGMAGAVASSYAMVRLRRAAGEALDLPDPAVAMGEDAATLGFGHVLVQNAVG